MNMKVDRQASRASQVQQAISDPLRMHALSELIEGWTSLGDLKRRTSSSEPEFTHALEILRDADLIEVAGDIVWITTAGERVMTACGETPRDPGRPEDDPGVILIHRAMGVVLGALVGSLTAMSLKTAATPLAMIVGMSIWTTTCAFYLAVLIQAPRYSFQAKALRGSILAISGLSGAAAAILALHVSGASGSSFAISIGMTISGLIYLSWSLLVRQLPHGRNA